MRLTYEPASEPLHISVELLAKGFAIRTEIVCGSVCKAHRLCVSLNSRLESNKEVPAGGAIPVLRAHAEAGAACTTRFISHNAFINLF